MTLDSNTVKDVLRNPLPHFTLSAPPGSLGVNRFVQDVALYKAIVRQPHVFLPMVLMGPVVRFLLSFSQSCTILVLYVFPKRY